MSFRIKTESELRGTLGNRTFNVGRETREKMVKHLFKHAKLGFGLEAGKKHLVIGQTEGTGKHVHFQMHDERAGGLDELDVHRLGDEFFGRKHEGQLMMSKGEMAENLRKRMKGLSKNDAKRLVETLVNEIHGGKSHEKEEKKMMEKKERVLEVKKDIERRRKEKKFGVIPKRLPFEKRETGKRFGKRGEILEEEKERMGGLPDHAASDPRDMKRGAKPEPERGGEEGKVSFRDLKLK